MAKNRQRRSNLCFEPRLLRGVYPECVEGLLRNKLFDPYRRLMAARHSGQGRRPRPVIQEENTGLPPARECSCTYGTP